LMRASDERWGNNERTRGVSTGPSCIQERISSWYRKNEKWERDKRSRICYYHS
jgi:hypothetical protein